MLSASIYVGFRNEDDVFVCTIDTIVASMFEENQRFISDFRFTSLRMLIAIGPKFDYNIFTLILCSVAFSCIRKDKKRVNIIEFLFLNLHPIILQQNLISVLSRETSISQISFNARPLLKATIIEHF